MVVAFLYWRFGFGLGFPMGFGCLGGCCVWLHCGCLIDGFNLVWLGLGFGLFCLRERVLLGLV